MWLLSCLMFGVLFISFSTSEIQSKCIMEVFQLSSVRPSSLTGVGYLYPFTSHVPLQFLFDFMIVSSLVQHFSKQFRLLSFSMTELCDSLHEHQHRPFALT